MVVRICVRSYWSRYGPWGRVGCPRTSRKPQKNKLERQGNSDILAKLRNPATVLTSVRNQSEMLLGGRLDSDSMERNQSTNECCWEVVWYRKLVWWEGMLRYVVLSCFPKLRSLKPYISFWHSTDNMLRVVWYTLRYFRPSESCEPVLIWMKLV